MNDIRYAVFLYHQGHIKCVNLGAAIKESHKGDSIHRPNPPRLSANCAKYNKHRSQCNVLNCTCGCHKGGTK